MACWWSGESRLELRCHPTPVAARGRSLAFMNIPAECKVGEANPRAAIDCRLVRQEACTSDIGGSNAVGEWIPVFEQRGNELVHEMRMGTAMPFQRSGIGDEMGMRSVRIGAMAMREMRIFRQIEEGFRREVTDRFGKQMRIIRRGSALCRPFLRLFGRVQHEPLALHQGPL